METLTLKAAAGTALAWFAGVPIVIWGLLGLMALDLVSGLMAAYNEGRISSDASFRGMMKKAMVLVVVLACMIAGKVGGFDLPVPAYGLVAGAFCVTEFISILENAVRMGIGLPLGLDDLLARGLAKHPRRADQVAKE